MIFMNYYYDVTLNFDLECLWNFYEWEKDDLLMEIRKIPLFRVNFDTMKDFLSHHICVSKSFVDEIAHKTTLKSCEEVYAAFLMSDSKNSLAVLLNESGHVIALSKLLVSDDNNVNEYMYTLRETEIPYEILGIREKRKMLRQEEKIKNFILLEMKTLLEEKNVSKLKYWYYECFSSECDDIQIMYDNMLRYLDEPMNANLERLSYLIRLSYHSV